jgi:dTDP-4-dehydrorhamnose reductase
VRILLFGKTGQIGSRLLTALAPLGDVIAPSSTEADFRHPDSVIASVRNCQPALIVNAAAYTAVDDAEHDRQAAELVNGAIPRLLAQEAVRANSALVHYSTDYVFDGAKNEPYVEQDPPAPINEYGRSKLAGERAIADSGAAHLTIRTSWIYAATGKNFLLTILRLAETQPELRIVADQTGCPTSADVVANATVQALTFALQQSPRSTPADALRRFSGVYHVACAGKTSWHGLAVEIVEQSRRLALLSRDNAPLVRAISTSEFPRPAQRPVNSVLATLKFTSTFGIALEGWNVALDAVLRQITVLRSTAAG